MTFSQKTSPDIDTTKGLPDSSAEMSLQTKWYNSLSFKVSMTLLILLLITSGAIYYFIKSDGRQALLKESEKLTEQVGSNAVNRLSIQISKIETLTKAQAALAESIEDTPERYIEVLSKNLDTQNDSNIISGGYWTMPTKAIGETKQAVFWSRNAFNMFEYNDAYENDTSYLQQEWFNIAGYGQKEHCAWSRLYKDSLTGTVKMTCAVAVKRKSDFLGVATVDMNLSELDAFAAEIAKEVSGYVFITDKDSRFIAFGHSQANGQKISVSESHTAQDYTKQHEDFNRVSAAIDQFTNETSARAKKRLADKFNTFVGKLREDTPQLSQKAAEINIASLNDMAAGHKKSALYAIETITADPILERDDSTAYLFHVPGTFWTLGIVIPNDKATAVADNLSSKLLFVLLGMIAVLAIVIYLMIQRMVLNPIQKTSDAMQKVGQLINQQQYLSLPEEKLSVQYEDEVGMVRQSVNLLIDRVVENEGELARINTTLENRVKKRTAELTKAMKDLEQSQLHLVQSEKMSLLGQMVAGVTHEVNTPLGYVKNNVIMCQDLIAQYNELLGLNRTLKNLLADANADEEKVAETINQMNELVKDIEHDGVEEDLKEIFDDTLFGIEQISELVVGLKDFSRLDEAKIKSVDIHDCIQSALKIAQSNIKRLKIKKKYDKNLPTVDCSPSQINQVLLNLFNNAADATEGENPAMLTIKTYQKKGFVCIDVQDNGCGMPESTIQKIFDPFFTTKPSGKGTGLGLAICNQIIEQHQGRIKVASKPDVGTKFSIRLPIVSEL